MLILYKNDRNVRFVSFTKTSNDRSLLSIGRRHIRVPKGKFEKITIKGSLLKFMSNSDLSLCHHLRSDLKV